MQRRPMALGALALSLAGIIGLELRPPPAGEEPVARSTVVPPPAPRAPLPPDGHGAAWAAAALARPLFSEDRRPPSPPTDAAAEPPPLPRLTGTLIGPFGRRALLVAGSSDKPVALGESDRVGVWTVEAISEGHVTLRGPDGAQSLRVGFAAPPPGGQVQAASVVRCLRRHDRT